MAQDEIASRIKKLLNMTPANGCTEAEAASAMAMAQRLLIEHNLSMSSVKATGENHDDTGLMNDVVDFGTEATTWQAMLLNAVATNNFCRVIRTAPGVYHILGRMANVAVVESLYNWIEPQVLRMAGLSGFKRADKTQYIVGMVSTLNRKLEEAKNQYQAEHESSRALIVNIQSEINNWYRQQYPNATTRTTRTTASGAYYQGKADGGRVSIHGSGRQVTAGRLLLN